MAKDPITPRVASVPKTRRIRFRFGEDGSYGKHFVNNDIVFSHVVATLSGLFPPGEDSVIRAVRRVADRITDPVLKKQVAGLIGQESTHAQEHRRLNKKLVEMGYPIQSFDSKSSEDRQIRGGQRQARMHLAFVALAEHFNAVVARRVLSSDEIQAIPGDPEVWHLLNWHALEELEHKSVALDVYRAVGGSERLRIAIAVIGWLVAVPMLLVTVLMSLGRDPVARRKPSRLVREAYALYRGPLGRGFLSEMAKYLRPGFHPVDIDTDGLVERSQQELFGARGVLADHLK
jgi:uncharacterized protein